MLIPLKGLEKLQESFLSQILRLFPVTDMEKTVLKDLRVILPDETFDRTVVSVFHSLYQKEIRIHLVLLSLLQNVFLKPASIIYNG